MSICQKPLELKDITWEQLLAMDKQTVLYDTMERIDDQCGVKGWVRIMIVRGPFALLAYVGIQKTHPLARIDFGSKLPLRCHWGITFASEGKKDSHWHKDFYWWGWDYGHADDHMFYYDDPSLGISPMSNTVKRLPWEAYTEALDVAEQLIRLMDIAELVYYLPRE